MLKKFTKEQIIKAIENTRNAAQASAYLGVRFPTFSRHVKKFNLQSSNKSIRKPYIIPLIDILDGKYPAYNTGNLKKRLFKEGIKKEKCEGCGETEWVCKKEIQKIPLELHHKNGNPHDHRKENLEILCPNCHTFTETYRGKNKAITKAKQKEIRNQIQNINDASDKLPKKIIVPPKIKTIKNCTECGHVCKRGRQKYCSQECVHQAQRRVYNRPPKEVLENEIKNTPFTTLAKKYGVSDNAIRKWAWAYRIELPERINSRHKKKPILVPTKHIETPLFPV